MSQASISDIPAASTASSEEVLVRVEGVSKKFCRSLKKSLWYGVCDIAGELSPFQRQARGKGPEAKGEGGQAGLRDGEFWAVNDVSFELRRGECVGLIGHNGAGKTTLLKMLNGLIKPDSGKITMRGRVGALIALGAGFNPILTGRENIYINGSVLGLSKKEIDGKVDEIIDFAEIGDFIDSPVQIYSSGMQVRLGFAVATALDPDILILDEVLAVGDAMFRSKCYKRIASIRQNAAVIFVSHAMEQVGRICGSVAVMDKGRRMFLGDTAEGICLYEKLLIDGRNPEASFNEISDPFTHVTARSKQNRVAHGQSLTIAITSDLKTPRTPITVRLVFYDRLGNWVADAVSTLDDGTYLPSGLSLLEVEIESLTLKPGVYEVTLHMLNAQGDLKVWLHKHLSVEVTGAHPYQNAVCQLCAVARLQPA
jgi:lipopolysaccharide transport system ATP-binding protein